MGCMELLVFGGSDLSWWKSSFLVDNGNENVSVGLKQ